LLTKLRFDSLVSIAGIESALTKLGLTQPQPRILPRLTDFLVLLILANTVPDALGLAALVFGLSFGLGTRDIVRNILSAFMREKFWK